MGLPSFAFPDHYLTLPRPLPPPQRTTTTAPPRVSVVFLTTNNRLPFGLVKNQGCGWFCAGGGGVRRLGFNHPPGDLGSGMGSGDSRGGCRDRGVSGQARDSGVGMGLTANGGLIVDWDGGRGGEATHEERGSRIDSRARLAAVTAVRVRLASDDQQGFV
ncbi:hypothetical protein Tco_0638035 [Tanacetum coccineum]